MKIRHTIENEITWEQLKAAAESGTVGALVQPFNEIDLELEGGEKITVVVAGTVAPELSVADAVELVGERIAAGEPLSAAVAAVATETGVARKALYAAALAARKDAK